MTINYMGIRCLIFCLIFCMYLFPAWKLCLPIALPRLLEGLGATCATSQWFSVNDLNSLSIVLLISMGCFPPAIVHKNAVLAIYFSVSMIYFFI